MVVLLGKKKAKDKKNYFFCFKVKNPSSSLTCKCIKNQNTVR